MAMQTDQQTTPTAKRPSFWRRHWRLAWIAGAFLLTLLAAGVTVAVLVRRIEPFLRTRIVAGLEDHFHSHVELDSFHVSLSDGVWAQGKGLRIWPPVEVYGVTIPPPSGQVEPLIRLNEFRFHAPLRLRPGGPIHIPAVELKGLYVNLPPTSHFQHQPAPEQPKPGKRLIDFQIGVLECNGAHLVLGTSKPGKLPLDFEISHFKVTNIRPDGEMNIEAELINPRPVGVIYSTARFGPWHTDDPGDSPVTGDFRFDHANLATFKGIAGILSSTGHYQGTLRDLVVDGQTETPDFRLTRFGNPVDLHTRYHAKVDGTDGDTWLEPVEATLGQSHFWAQGQIVRVRVPDNGDEAASGKMRTIGHDIQLDVNVDKAHIEDFLRLASHSPAPLLTGGVAVKAQLHIAPGKDPVPDRMNLRGHFLLDQARFTSPKIQDRVDELSLRGQGRPKEAKAADPDPVNSQMQGDFVMDRGVVTLPALKYNVPGAEIQLNGTYKLDGGLLAFHGTARLEATISQMVGGWKGFFLKPVDHFFKKDGAGAEIPIHVLGSRDAPEFGVDLDRMKKTSPERPGDKP